MLLFAYLVTVSYAKSNMISYNHFHEAAFCRDTNVLGILSFISTLHTVLPFSSVIRLPIYIFFTKAFKILVSSSFISVYNLTICKKKLYLFLGIIPRCSLRLALYIRPHNSDTFF